MWSKFCTFKFIYTKIYMVFIGPNGLYNSNTFFPHREHFAFFPNNYINGLNLKVWTLSEFASIGTNIGFKSSLDMKENRKCITISSPTSIWKKQNEGSTYSNTTHIDMRTFILNLRAWGWNLEFTQPTPTQPYPPFLNQPPNGNKLNPR